MTLTRRWRSWSSRVGDRNNARMLENRASGPNWRALSVSCRSAACYVTQTMSFASIDIYIFLSLYTIKDWNGSTYIYMFCLVGEG